jgi:predicted metal-binding protein
MSNKIDNLLNSNLADNFTFIFSNPNEIEHDPKTEYCCMQKCPNYAKRCFCPPFISDLRIQSKNKKYVIIIVRTVGYKNIPQIKENPKKNNPEYLKDHAFELYKAAETEFKDQILQIFKWWKLNKDEIFSLGFPLTTCDCCFQKVSNQKKGIKGIKKECFPMPSVSGFEIDINKTMRKFNYNLDFNLNESMSRVAMIFTDNPDCAKYLKQTVSHNNQSPPLIEKQVLAVDVLLKEKLPNLEFSLIYTEHIIDELKEEYQYLKLWSHAILWTSNIKDSSSKDKNQLKQDVHRIVFNLGFYYALDFIAGDILKPQSKISKYYGIEFY